MDSASFTGMPTVDYNCRDMTLRRGNLIKHGSIIGDKKSRNDEGGWIYLVGLLYVKYIDGLICRYGFQYTAHQEVEGSGIMNWQVSSV